MIRKTDFRDRFLIVFARCSLNIVVFFAHLGNICYPNKEEEDDEKAEEEQHVSYSVGVIGPV